MASDVLGRLQRLPTRVSLWGFFAAISFARFPALFKDAAFYAEEGNVYFGYAANNGVIDSLFESHVGYFSLFANVAGIVSAAVPLEYAVVATRALGILGPAVCAWVIIEIPSRRLVRAAALAVVVFTYTMSEEWATTIHAQFWFAVAVIVMIAVPATSRSIERGQYAVTVVAGLSGVLACVAAPVYIALAVRERNRRDAVVGGILSVALLIQLAVGASRDASWHAGEFVVVAFLKLAFFPVSGVRGNRVSPGWYESWTFVPVAALFALLLVGWIAFVVWTAHERWRLVAATSLSVGLLGIYFALPPYSDLAYSHLGTRYSVAGVVPVLIALVVSIDRRRLLIQIVVIGIVAVAIVRGIDSGADLASAQLARDSVWLPGVERYQADPGAPITTNSSCLVAENGRDQRTGFGVEVVEPALPGGLSFVVTPGQYDLDRMIEMFVFSDESVETLTPDGWELIPGFLYGDDNRRCHSSSAPVEMYGPAEGEFQIDISKADTDDLAQRSTTISIGYGRDFADALAKDTQRAFMICRLRNDPCP